MPPVCKPRLPASAAEPSRAESSAPVAHSLAAFVPVQCGWARRQQWAQVVLAIGLAAFAVSAIGLGPAGVPFVAIAALTPALVVTDLREHRIPNRLVLVALAAAIIGVIGEWLVGADVTVASVSGAACFAFYLVLAIAGGMGMGDVKLAGVLGLAAGLAGPTEAILSPALAFGVGGLVAVGLLAIRSCGRRVPFGPFMLGGFWLAVAVAY